MAGSGPLDDESLQKIYTWVDQIPLSRPKRNITRDFSDGVLFAEVINHYFPRMVELHNYSSASSVRQKLYNWSTLNAKVLKRLKFSISKEEMEDTVNCVPGVVEMLLMRLQSKMAQYRQRKAKKSLSAAAGESDMGGRSTAGSSTGGSIAPYSAGSQGALHIDGAAGFGASGQASAALAASQQANLASAVADKDASIQELSETIEFLELKVAKLEQLLRLKDNRIHTLTARLQSSQLGGSGQ
ncbi:SPEF1 [Symbiodinium sp. KB8]|nr:SPEF1 [Symbiodinium sp. KB8]